MRSTRLVSAVSFTIGFWFLLQSAAGVWAQNPTVGFSISPNEFRVGQSATTLLSVTSSSASLTISTGDKFTFIFDASVGAVSSVSPKVSVDSSSLAASDFSATSTATQVVLSYNGAARPFSFGSAIAVEVHFTASGQVATGKVSFSSRFTSSVNGNLPYIPVSIVDFANPGVTSVVHDPTLSCIPNPKP